MKYLILALLLTGCGGGGGSSDKDPVVIEKPPVKDTLVIYDNTDYTTLNSVSNAITSGYKATIVRASYSQAERDKAVTCPNCFDINNSVILGDDINCEDCLKLQSFLDYAERDFGTKVFIVIEDDLTFEFTQSIVSTRGYSDIVFVSSMESVLALSIYNYELAFIGDSSELSVDWYITADKNCKSKCIHPLTTNDVTGEYDGVIND